jgi:hypothetical protein
MNDGLPTRMPEPPPPVVTKVPRVFGPWGTISYGIAAVASIVTVLLNGFTGWTPPWYFTSAAFMYVFISAGIICMGRIQSNKDAKFFIHALRKRSEENKNNTRWLN